MEWPGDSQSQDNYVFFSVIFNFIKVNYFERQKGQLLVSLSEMYHCSDFLFVLFSNVSQYLRTFPVFSGSAGYLFLFRAIFPVT